MVVATFLHLFQQGISSPCATSSIMNLPKSILKLNCTHKEHVSEVDRSCISTGSLRLSF